GHRWPADQAPGRPHEPTGNRVAQMDGHPGAVRLWTESGLQADSIRGGAPARGLLVCADLRSFAMRVTPICRYVRCRRLGDAGFIVRRHLSIWRAPRRNDTCRLYVNGRRAILNNRQDCTRLQSTIRDWGD